MLRAIQQAQRKINATIVGSLDVSNPDNIVSGFTRNYYLTLPNNPPSLLETESHKVEMVFKVKFTSLSKYVMRSDSGQLGLAVSSNDNIYFFSDNLSSWYNTTFVPTVNEWVYLRVLIETDGTTNTIKIGMSSDNITYQEGTTTSSAQNLPILPTGYGIVLGTNKQTYNEQLNGYIDMKETYIKIDNVFWWKGVK